VLLIILALAVTFIDTSGIMLDSRLEQLLYIQEEEGDIAVEEQVSATSSGPTPESVTTESPSILDGKDAMVNTASDAEVLAAIDKIYNKK
jgi:hypothetical protein